MAQINIAEAAANHAVFREKRETPPGATAIYEFLAENRQHLRGGQLTSNIAVLASLNQYLAEELSFAFSASRVLSDLGINHVMIVEADLDPAKLAAFDAVYVPYMPLLGPEKQQALLDYVTNGGRLLILGECGVKSAHNLPLEQPPLAAGFGGKRFPAQETGIRAGKGSMLYLPLPIPESRYLVQVAQKGEVTTFGPAMTDVFPDIPEAYTRSGMDPVLRRHLDGAAKALLRILDGAATRRISEAPLVEISAMMSPGSDRMLLHVVNYDVTLAGEVTPATDLQLHAVLPPGRRATAVHFSGNLGEMQPLPFRQDRRGATNAVLFSAPSVDIYGLAMIIFEEEK